MEYQQTDHQTFPPLRRQFQCHSGTRLALTARPAAVAAMFPSPDRDRAPLAELPIGQMHHGRHRRSPRAPSATATFLAPAVLPYAMALRHSPTVPVFRAQVVRVWVVRLDLPILCDPPMVDVRSSGNRPGAHLAGHDPCRARHYDHAVARMTNLVALVEGGPDVVRPTGLVSSSTHRFVPRGGGSSEVPQTIRVAPRKGDPDWRATPGSHPGGPDRGWMAFQLPGQGPRGSRVRFPE